MAQLFSKTSDFFVRTAIVVGVLGFVGACWAWYEWHESDLRTRVGFHVEQPVPFSHVHHVQGLGLDCRYCHQTVETEAFAGLPSTNLCMNCHSQLWTQAKLLQPVRESWRTGRRLQWNRVNKVGDFVYFNHSIHVTKGIGCATCHGRVDEMPLTAKGTSLFMKDCIACHRDPAKNLRPESAVTDMTWRPPADQAEQGKKLMEQYGIDNRRLTDCTTCHR